MLFLCSSHHGQGRIGQRILEYDFIQLHKIYTKAIFGLRGQIVVLIGAIIFCVYFHSIYFNVAIVAFVLDLRVCIYM